MRHVAFMLHGAAAGETEMAENCGNRLQHDAT